MYSVQQSFCNFAPIFRTLQFLRLAIFTAVLLFLQMSSFAEIFEALHILLVSKLHTLVFPTVRSRVLLSLAPCRPASYNSAL